MRSDQAKQIHMRDLLAVLGCQPVREQKGELWYLSPFRQETDASFKITRDGKAWYDHGEGAGGNILKFACRYYGLADQDIRGALRKLDALNIVRTLKVGDASMQPSFWNTSPSPVEARTDASAASGSPDSDMVVKRVQALQNQALVQYLKARGIDADTAKPYVQEIYYTQKNKPYFALAFANDSGGHELRNRYFKGAVGSKDITTIRVGEGATESVAVFEGFIDFLSALTLVGRSPAMDCLILNSVAMRERAIDAIRQMQAHTVHLYLDRDAPGHTLAEKMQEQLAGVRVIDESKLYSGYKDLNDFLIARTREPALAR